MIDIERKTLKLLQQHVNDLNIFISHGEEIKKQIIEDVTHIDEWDSKLRLQLYKEICKDILSFSNIDDVHFQLSIIQQLYKRVNDVDLGMIYAVLVDFFPFFDRIYEWVMLNQILFLLTSFSLEELSQSEVIKKRYSTNSYYESVYFGLDFEQMKLYSFFDEEFSQFLYCVKAECKQTIAKLLQMPEYQAKWEALDATLEDYIFREGQDNYYSQRLFLALHSFDKKPVRARVKKVDEDDLQLTLF